MLINADVTIIYIVIVVSSIVMYWFGSRIKKRESALHSERLKLMHERTELERKYHYYM